MFHMIFVSVFLNLKVACVTTFAALVSSACTEVDFFARAHFYFIISGSLFSVSDNRLSVTPLFTMHSNFSSSRESSESLNRNFPQSQLFRKLRCDVLLLS